MKTPCCRASKINEGEYRNDVHGRDWFSLPLIAETEKQTETQPDGVIYLQ